MANAKDKNAEQGNDEALGSVDNSDTAKAAEEIAKAKAEAAKEIEAAKAAAAEEIAKAKTEAKKILAAANAKAGKDAEKAPKTPHTADIEAIKAEAMVPTQVTGPKILGVRKPYETTVLAKGMPDYHARIPRGVPVVVPYYVAEAIREDVLQNEKTEALVEKLTQEFLEKADKVLKGAI